MRGRLRQAAQRSGRRCQVARRQQPDRPEMAVALHRPSARRQLHRVRRDHLAEPGARLPVDLAARRVLPQSGIERRLDAGRGVRRQARSTRQGRDRGQRRRLLHVRHADPCAVGGQALQRAVHVDRVTRTAATRPARCASTASTARRTATPPRPITTAATSTRRSTSPRRRRPPAATARTSPIRRRSSRRCDAG